VVLVLIGISEKEQLTDIEFSGLFNWILEKLFGFCKDWIWIDIKTYQSIAEAKMVHLNELKAAVLLFYCGVVITAKQKKIRRYTM
jgi:hypothetical protein